MSGRDPDPLVRPAVVTRGPFPMTKIVEIGAMALGGLSLFAVCFLGFALAAGVPAHDVALLGKLFPEPALEELGPPPGTAPGQEPTLPQVSGQEAVQSNSAVLGTWTLPSPFDQEELRGLVDELKTRRSMIDLREQELNQRESELDDRAELNDERLVGLGELQKRLEAWEIELSLRSREVAREEVARDETRAAQLRALGRVLATMDPPSKAVSYLIGYEPKEVAIVLASLDTEAAAAILDGLASSPAVMDIKPYLDAFARAAAETP